MLCKDLRAPSVLPRKGSFMCLGVIKLIGKVKLRPRETKGDCPDGPFLAGVFGKRRGLFSTVTGAVVVLIEQTQIIH